MKAHTNKEIVLTLSSHEAAALSNFLSSTRPSTIRANVSEEEIELVTKVQQGLKIELSKFSS